MRSFFHSSTSSPSLHLGCCRQAHSFGIGTVNCQFIPPLITLFITYSTHPEVTEDTPASTSHNTSVLDLGEARVAVHLGKLELGLGANSLRERGISDYVAEGLSIWKP